MQNSKKSFITILCLLALLLIAFKPDSTVQPSMELNYHVSIITHIDKYPKEYQHLVGHEIEIAKIEGLPISEIETKVNDTIYHATLSWISGKVLHDLPNNTSINLQSNRYLSITNFFPNYGDNHFFEWAIWDYITIDISTGERIFLEDLVEVCDEFIYLIKTEKIAYAENFEYTLSDEGLWEWLAKMSVDELSERLEECSKTQQDIIDAGYGPPDETLGPLIFRNNFYLEPGKLILWFGGVDKKIIIDVNDIQEFLKVPAW